MSTSKITLYSQPDLKSTTDDALPNFLNSLKFQQSHLLADVRLLLGYTAVTLGAATFYADYKLGWVETKAYTLWAVVAYFTLNSALTIWIWAIEKGCIYNGSRGLVTLSISSSVSKHTPNYRLRVQYTESNTGKAHDSKVKSIEAPFTNWFTEEGVFSSKPFQQWLLDEIPRINKMSKK